MYNITFKGLDFEIKIDPVAFSVGSITIYWYGVLIALGLTLGVLYTYFFSKKYNVDKNKLIDCIIVGILTGVIGARLYFVLFKWDDYSQDLSKIFNINEGGLAIYGGLIGAFLGGCIVAKLHKMNVFAVLDVAVMGFLIGQGIGRWGNFTNQEAFGTPTDMPWGMLSQNTGGEFVHPCFLYESLWCILGFLLIHFIFKKRQKYCGQIFYLYLIWYGFERMIVEGLRTDSLYLPFSIGGFEPRVSQLLSLILLAFGIVMIIKNRKKVDDFYAADN